MNEEQMRERRNEVRQELEAVREQRRDEMRNWNTSEVMMNLLEERVVELSREDMELTEMVVNS